MVARCQSVNLFFSVHRALKDQRMLISINLFACYLVMPCWNNVERGYFVQQDDYVIFSFEWPVFFPSLFVPLFDFFPEVMVSFRSFFLSCCFIQIINRQQLNLLF